MVSVLQFQFPLFSVRRSAFDLRTESPLNDINQGNNRPTLYSPFASSHDRIA